MNKADTIKMIAVMVKAYPNSDKYQTETDIQQTVNLWATVFVDDDVNIVNLALMKHIQTSKWPPSIAEIREIMMTIQCPDLIPPDEAWLAVSDVMYSAGEFGYGAENSLPPLIRRAVSSIGWSNLWQMHRSGSMGKTAGMDRVAFMDIYKPLYERERQRMQLAPSIREKIDKTTAALSGEGRRCLESAKQKREEKEQFYRDLERGMMAPRLETTREPELLENKEDVQ